MIKKLSTLILIPFAVLACNLFSDESTPATPAPTPSETISTRPQTKDNPLQLSGDDKWSF